MQRLKVAPIRFTWSFFAEGRRMSRNYEAVELEGEDENSFYVWVRDLERDSFKYIAVPKRRRVEMGKRKLDKETRMMVREWEWEYLETPEWLRRLKTRAM
jgi:hypothetical protein